MTHHNAGTVGEVEVTCFRGVRRAQFSLGQITVLTGRNNAGKSSVLEALALGFSAPRLQDWLGNDIVRILVDGKLGGYPDRLLNSECTEATVRLKVSGEEKPRVLRIAGPSPAIGKLVAHKILQQLASTLHEELAHEGKTYQCLRRQLPAKPGEREAIATLILTTAYLLTSLAIMVYEGKIPQIQTTIVLPITIPDIILRTFYGMESALVSTASELAKQAERTVNTLIRDGITIVSGKTSLLYLPREKLNRYRDGMETGFLWHELLRGTISITGSVLGRAGIQDLYNTYTKLQLGRELERLLRHCLWEALNKTITSLLGEKAIRIDNSEKHGTAWNVYTVFRRVLSLHQKAFNASSLTKVVEAIHLYGLLGEYSKVIEKLKLKDPIVVDEEVYVYAVDSRTSVPAAVLGDGTLQLLVLLAGLVLARRQQRTVLVFEEPETGLHPGYLMLLADNMARAVRENSSAFILLSTHSEELIRFIAERAERHGVIDRVETILMSNGEVYSVFHGKEVLEAHEIGAELRGI